MEKKDFVKFIKIGSIVLSIFGMIGSTLADSYENKETIRELINLQLKKGE